MIQCHIERQQHRQNAAKEPKNTWYLPHYAVTNPNKPGKVCIVFDAAASYKGTSLNDQLVTGPDLQNSLVGVIMRFGLHAVAMIADIEAMFFQVLVIEKDQPSPRFLWRGPNRDHPPDVYQMQAMIVSAKSSPTSANYCLKRTAIDNQNTSSEETTGTVLRDFYMDDLLLFLLIAQVFFCLDNLRHTICREVLYRLISSCLGLQLNTVL